MDLTVGNECYDTGSPGGGSGKIWNNSNNAFLVILTWNHHDCRKGVREDYSIPNTGRGFCTEKGMLSYEANPLV